MAKAVPKLKKSVPMKAPPFPGGSLPFGPAPKGKAKPMPKKKGCK